MDERVGVEVIEGGQDPILAKWLRKKGPVAKMEKVCSEREERSGNDEDETED